MLMASVAFSQPARSGGHARKGDCQGQDRPTVALYDTVGSRSGLACCEAGVMICWALDQGCSALLRVRVCFRDAMWAAEHSCPQHSCGQAPARDPTSASDAIIESAIDIIFDFTEAPAYEPLQVVLDLEGMSVYAAPCMPWGDNGACRSRAALLAR